MDQPDLATTSTGGDAGSRPMPAMPVHEAEMSERVWLAILRAGDGWHHDEAADWSPREWAAWSLYAPIATAGRPIVFAQTGQSLDGRVATAEGDAADISGSDGLRHLHRCRALADAVVVGASTAVQDDPRLTVRLVQGRNPARVVIDPNGRLGDDAGLFGGDGQRRLVVQGCDRQRPDGVETIRLPRDADGGLDARAIVDQLVDRGFRRILVEGGGTTIGRFLDGDMLDRLHLGIAPLIIGSGIPGLAAAPIARLAQARRPATRVFGLGSDIVVDCDLRSG